MTTSDDGIVTDLRKTAIVGVSVAAALCAAIGFVFGFLVRGLL